MIEDSVDMNQGNQLYFFLVKFSILFVVLQSLFAWFLWQLNPYVPGLINVLIFTGYIVASPSSFELRKSNLVSIALLVIVQLYCVKGSNLNGYIAAIINLLPIFFLLLLIDDLKAQLLHFITRGFSFLLGVSLIAWILYLIGISLPHSTVSFNNGQYWFSNYYFFLLDVGNISIFPRFSSVFLEPGHLGMITSFLLFSNQFNIRRVEVVILLIATILTFSLAAYLLFIFSFAAFVIIRTNRPVIYISILVVFVMAGAIFSKAIFGGDNYLNILIFERLQFVNGEFTGNNRFSIELNTYFQNFVSSRDFWMGIGVLNFENQNFGANAGYKVYLVQHGLIGTLLLFLFYFSVVLSNRTKGAYFFLIIFILAFLQRSYALWAVELVIFITSVSCFYNDQYNEVEDSH